LEVRAVFRVRLEESEFLREGSASYRFVVGGHGTEYKAVGAGRYWREACDPEQLSHGGGDPVPLDITTSDGSQSFDFLELDPTARFLGPGLGELSPSSSSNHPWLAVGPRKSPRDLVYVGDLAEVVLPDGGESPDKGDRRTWACAFTARATRVSAKVDGAYVPLGADQRLQEVFRTYQRRASRQLPVGDPRSCSPAHLYIQDVPSVAQVEPSDGACQAVEATVALGVARSGIPLKEFQELVGRVTGRHDFLLWQQVIRAWADGGLVDLLRRQDRSQTMVVPCDPQFVMVKRGPAVDATLLGLVARGVDKAIEAVLRAPETVIRVPATTAFQPSALRLVGAVPDRVQEISRTVGILPPEWLYWPDINIAPPPLSIKDDLRGLVHGCPPDAYRFDARWDWDEMIFHPYQREGAPELVEVERRRHPQRCSIYVVLVDGEAMLWCHLRSWALLRAAELREEPPFAVSAGGDICSHGFSPIHLPLPFGRLCAVLGAGLPGPHLGDGGRVVGYWYRFGGALHMVRRLLPQAWIKSESRGA